MANDKDIPIDWRFQEVLDGATMAHNQRLAFVRAGGTLRTQAGERATWRKGFPSPEEKEAAKGALGPPESFLSHCPSCNRTFLIPTIYISIRDHGMCSQCCLHEEMFEGTFHYRTPTLKEVLEVPTRDLRGAEIDVLYREVQG